MPKLITEIEDSKTVLYRPVILQIVKDIRELTGFPNDVKYYYLDEVKQTVNLESVMDSNDIEMVNFSHENRITISSTFNYADLSIYNGQPFKGSSKPILYDEIHKIKLSPINFVMEVDITVVFTSKDRLTLERWKNGLRIRLSQSAKAYQHQINYLYPIDPLVLEILTHLYKTKEKYVYEDDSFKEWLERISYERITGVSNQIGMGTISVVEQSQIGVIGIWNFNETPEIEKAASGDNYQATLPYKIKLSLPSGMTLEYPIILNNSVIDTKYRPDCDFNTELVLGTPEKLLWGLYATLDRVPIHYPSVPLILPCYDEWRPERVPLGTATIYQALISISDDDLTYVMDLTDLGEDYVIATWFKEMMEYFNQDILTPNASPIIVSLYRNTEWVETNNLLLTKDLKLYTKCQMQYYNQHRVRLALYTDLSLLSEKALEKLRVNSKLTIQLFKMLGPEFIDEVPEPTSDGSLNIREMWDYISLLKETESSYKNKKEIRRLTVGSCLIDVRRKI